MNDVAGLTAQLQAGTASNTVLQQQLAGLVANTGVIAGLKDKIKEQRELLRVKTRELHAAEQLNITLQGVQYDLKQVEQKIVNKNELIKGLKLELATLKRKVVSHAKATIGACVCVCVCACVRVCVCACVCVCEHARKLALIHENCASCRRGPRRGVVGWRGEWQRQCEEGESRWQGQGEEGREGRAVRRCGGEESQEGHECACWR